MSRERWSSWASADGLSGLMVMGDRVIRDRPAGKAIRPPPRGKI
jgi:hypothetical protein